MTTKIHVKLHPDVSYNAYFLLEKLKKDHKTRVETKKKEILDDYNSRGWFYKLLLTPDFDTLHWIYYDGELNSFLEELSKLSKSNSTVHELEVDVKLWNRYIAFHVKHIGDVKTLNGEYNV